MKNFWTIFEIELLKKEYPHKPTRDIVILFPGRTYDAIRIKAKKINLTKTKEGLAKSKLWKKTIWTKEKEAELIELYKTKIADEIAIIFGVSKSIIKNRINKLGLKKENNTSFFLKGRTSPNKGKKQAEYMTPEAIERTKATRFKKGDKKYNQKEVGFIRTNDDSYYVIKIKEPRTWELLHRVVYKENNLGIELKQNEIIAFKDGNIANISYSNLEKITRQESMKRTRNTDEYIAATIERNKEKRKEILNNPELIKLKRKLLTVKKLANAKA